MKAGRAALLSLIVLVLGAAPAGAVTPILAKAKPWHYWVSFVLALSFLGMAFMLTLGYLIRVVGPKYGVRVGKRSEG